MKSFCCLLALGLTGCATSTNFTYAPRELAAGYPVFVDNSGAKCLFQLQDMLVDREQLSEWMTDLADKARRVDLVVAKGAEACPSRAGRAIRSAGFVEIAFRRKGDVIYSNGQEPA